MVAHAFNPSTWEAEAGRFLNLRPAWSTEWVPRQPGLYRETLSQKKTKTEQLSLTPVQGNWHPLWSLGTPAKNWPPDLSFHLCYNCVLPNPSLPLSPKHKLWGEWPIHVASLTLGCKWLAFTTLSGGKYSIRWRRKSQWHFPVHITGTCGCPYFIALFTTKFL